MVRHKGELPAALAIVMALLVGACAGMETRKELPVVPSVDLDRYAGSWYEIARLPMWFQRHCVDSRAVYTVQSNRKLGVHNECVTDTGRIEQAEGIATVVDPKTNAKLSVVFDNWFAKLVGSSRDGNYWILDLDAEYRTALVGTPDRRHLWILARAPHMDQATYDRLVQKGRDLGYVVEDLIRDQRPPSEPTGSG